MWLFSFFLLFLKVMIDFFLSHVGTGRCSVINRLYLVVRWSPHCPASAVTTTDMAGEKKKKEMCRWLEIQRESTAISGVSVFAPRPVLNARCAVPQCDDAAFHHSAHFFLFIFFSAAARSTGACLQPCCHVWHWGPRHDTEQRLTAQHCVILCQRTMNSTVLVRVALQRTKSPVAITNNNKYGQRREDWMVFVSLSLALLNHWLYIETGKVMPPTSWQWKASLEAQWLRHLKVLPPTLALQPPP